MFHLYNILCLYLYTLPWAHCKNVFSTHHHTVDPLYSFCPSSDPFPSGKHYSIFRIYEFVSALLVCKFILFLFSCLFFILHIWMKLCHLFFFSIRLMSPRIIFSRPSMLLKMARFHRFYGRVVFCYLSVYHISLIHSSADGQIVYICWLLQIML